MKPEKKEALEKWHKEQNFVWVFRDEFLKYCDMDVEILWKSMVEFRRIFLELVGIDPLQYVTIASVCMAAYRSQFMPINSIRIIKRFSSDNFSAEGVNWVRFMEHKTEQKIQHVLNEGEVYLKDIGVKGKKVDGYCAETNTVYEYMGCYFHGCKRCFRGHERNTVQSGYMYQLPMSTEWLMNSIRDADNNLVTGV